MPKKPNKTRRSREGWRIALYLSAGPLNESPRRLPPHTCRFPNHKNCVQNFKMRARNHFLWRIETRLTLDLPTYTTLTKEKNRADLPPGTHRNLGVQNTINVKKDVRA